MKTYVATPHDRERNWLLVDAEGQNLGRLATQIADALRGKRKPTYTPHCDTGDFVVVINAEKISVTGKKRDGEDVLPPLGLPGRPQEPHAQRDAGAPAGRGHPPRRASGMLPKNRLARKQITKLKVYAGPEHPHAAQKPRSWRSSPDDRREEDRAGRGRRARRDRRRGRRRRRGDADASASRSASRRSSTSPSPSPSSAPPRRPRPPAEASPSRAEAPRRAPSRRAPVRGRRGRGRRAQETPRVKPEIPGMDLEPDIVREGEEALRARTRRTSDDDGDGRRRRGRSRQPIADAAIDLGAGARYRATGKRKTAVARVILKPGTGAYTINGRTLDEFFPRATLQRTIRQPLETVGLEEQMDVIATMHGGGVSAQAGALRHGISRALRGGRPEPALRAQAPRLPDARRARQGAQEGRPQEGPQAAAVLEALGRGLTRARKLFGTDGVRGVAGEFLTAELALALARAATRARPAPTRPRVLVIRDTRESGEMLEAAVAAGVAAGRRRGAARRRPADARRAAADRALRPRPRRRHLAPPTTRTPTTASSSSAGTASSSPTTTEAEIEAALDAPPRRAPRIGRVAPARTARSRTTCARCTSASRPRPQRPAHRARLRQRRDVPRRAGDLPPPRRRRRRPRRRAGRAQHQRGLRLHARRRADRRARARRAATTPASPSTATATACSPSTAPAPSSTATS